MEASHKMDDDHVKLTELSDTINLQQNCQKDDKSGRQDETVTISKTEKESEEEEEEEENSEWFDLLNNKDILKKTLVTVAEDAPRPVRGSQCTINLSTRNADTQEEIESETFENLEVIVGEYDLIHGLDLSLPLMHLGEEAQILIQPRFGYGLKGKKPDVPPNCRLDCRLKMVSIQEPDWIEEQEEEKLFELAKRKKERGNFWFGREEYSSAIVNYKRCVEFVEMIENRIAVAEDLKEDEGEEEPQDRPMISEEALQLKSTAHNNLALAYIRTESYNMALESVEAALQLSPENVKALFRKATILKLKGEIEDAITVLRFAIHLQPNNREVHSLIDELRKQNKKELQTEKQLYRRMLQSNSSTEEDKPGSSNDDQESDNDENLDDDEQQSKKSEECKLLCSMSTNLCKKVQSYFSKENHLNLVLAGSCFLTAFLSWLGYYLIFQ